LSARAATRAALLVRRISGRSQRLPEASHIHWQHGDVQDHDRPEMVEVTVTDEGEVADDRDRPQRRHLPGTEGGED
jgi:hypothetical protein